MLDDVQFVKIGPLVEAGHELSNEKLHPRKFKNVLSTILHQCLNLHVCSYTIYFYIQIQHSIRHCEMPSHVCCYSYNWLQIDLSHYYEY